MYIDGEVLEKLTVPGKRTQPLSKITNSNISYIRDILLNQDLGCSYITPFLSTLALALLSFPSAVQVPDERGYVFSFSFVTHITEKKITG